MKQAASLIALLACSQLLPAASYEELLASALAANGSQRKLEASAERADIAYKQAELARLSPAIKVQSGTTSATLSSSGLVAAAAPAASVGFAGGASLGLGSSLWLSPSGLWASGSGSVGIPIARSADEKLLASRAARQAYALAEAARLRGGLEIELALDQALAAAFQAEVALRSALRAQASAQRELERAVKIDGAGEGGSTYASLSRALRTAARASRDALAARAKAFAALRRAAGASGPGTADDELLPRALPEAPLAEPPASAELAYKVAAAEAAERLGREALAEKGRRSSLEAVAGASYGLGAAETAAAAATTTTSSSLLGGLGLSAGLKAALGRSGISVEAGLGWQESSGPSASISVAWSPSQRGGEELRDRDAELELELLGLELREARRAAAADAEDLASARSSLEEAAADAAEDLAYAEADLAAYGQGRDSGFVSEADYGEASAVRDECAARLLSVKLDRITWKARAALATAGAEAFEGLR